MEDKQLQITQYKFQKRIKRLNTVRREQFIPFLKQFFVYFNSIPILCSLRDDLIARSLKYDIRTTIDNVLEGQILHGGNEEEAASLGYEILSRLASGVYSFENFLTNYHIGEKTGNPEENIELFREEFLNPFYEYINEHIDDQHNVLYLLGKYMHRCEWFHSERLRRVVINDTSRGEKKLALDLYEYLHDSGIDFNIEPKSASGIPDFVIEQIGDNRIIADTKIYWPEKSKNKSYIIHGFNQIYTYLCDFNEAFGYLIIYNLTDEDVRFLLPQTRSVFPAYTYNNKTVYFVIINLYEHKSSASKRGQRKVIDITDTELVCERI